MQVQFKQITTPLVHAITGYYPSGNALSVEYKIGTLTTLEDGTNQFEELLSKSFWIDETKAESINNAPMTKDDIGKTPTEIMLRRIEEHLRSTGEIKL